MENEIINEIEENEQSDASVNTEEVEEINDLGQTENSYEEEYKNIKEETNLASFGDGAIDRLADEYIALKEEFPDVEGIDSIPDEVFINACKKGCSLADSYARYLLNEQRGIAAAAKASLNAATASAGSLKSEQMSDETKYDALMRGIWGKRK